MRDMGRDGGVVLVRPQKQPDTQDVRDLVTSAVDAFCEQFNLSGAAERRMLLRTIGEQALDLAGCA